MGRISMLGICLGEPFCVPLPKCELKNGLLQFKKECWADLGDEYYLVHGVNPLDGNVFVYGEDGLVESVVAVIPLKDSTRVLLAMTAQYGLPSRLSYDGNEAAWTIHDEASMPYRVVLKRYLEDGKDGDLSVTMAM